MLYYNYIAFCIAIFLYCFLHAVIFFLLECFGIPSSNMYVVMGNTGRKMFSVNEEEDFCCRLCCGSGRSFTMPVTDITGRHAISLIKSDVCNCQSAKVLELFILFVVIVLLIKLVEQD